MKLYATVTSERNSRPCRKGGDDTIQIELRYKNKKVGTILFWHTEVPKPEPKIYWYDQHESGHSLVIK